MPGAVLLASHFSLYGLQLVIFIFELLRKCPVEPCSHRARSQNTAVNLKKRFAKHCSFLRARAVEFNPLARMIGSLVAMRL
jgi:hypothetical protein